MRMKHSERPPLGSVEVFVVMLICGIVIMFYASVLANQTPAGAVMVGDATCLECHDDVGESWSMTLHGALSEKDGKIQCESCHGPGSAHVEEQDPALIINPAKTGQFDATPTCLGCHNTDTFDSWTFSHHNGADVNCSSCHTIHAEHETWSAEYVDEMCYNCHSDVRAQTYMPSHHPIREGKMSCLDCHNVHGGPADLTQENTTRELCFSCHPEKEGPFVFEHAPANEDCMICHTPHGSIADNLLTMTEPTLCLNCHAMHFHASLEAIDGEFTSPQDPNRTAVSSEDSFKKAMLTKCTTCHSVIHGTDLPSQATSTSGNALTR